MILSRFTKFSVFILFLTGLCYAANIDDLPEFSEETLPIHIENMRRVNADFRTLGATSDILSVSVETLETSVSTLEGIVNTNNVIKAWISFNGTGTIAINDSYNVSGIGDHGTGDYSVTWDTAFANTNYCPMMHTTQTSGSNLRCTIQVHTIATGSLRVETVDADGDLTDMELVYIIVTGDQ